MARTRNKEQTVRVKKRSSGKYSYFFEGIKTDGKRTQITKGGFLTEEDALAAGKIHLEEYYHGTVSKPKVNAEISFQDFVTNIFMPYHIEQNNILPSTKENYEKKLHNHIYPAVGKDIICNITPKKLQAILDKMFYDKRYSKNTVVNIHGLLLSIVEYAVKKEYLEKFDVSEFKIPKPDEDDDKSNRKQKRDTIPAEKIDAIFERFDENSSAFLPMAIALFTGARLGEACAIAVEDCDFENRKLQIRRQFPDNTKNIVCNPKYNSKRDVPMCEQLYQILKKAADKRLENENTWKDNYIRTYLTKQTNTDEYRNLHGYYDINFEGNGKELHFLNVNEYGKIIYPSVMKHASRIIHGFSSDSKIKKNKKKVIYEDFNFHSFRNTFSSSLKAQGVDTSVISSLLGHKMQADNGASKTTTRYIRYPFEHLKTYAETIDNIYKFKNKDDK